MAEHVFRNIPEQGGTIFPEQGTTLRTMVEYVFQTMGDYCGTWRNIAKCVFQNRRNMAEHGETWQNTAKHNQNMVEHDKK